MSILDWIITILYAAGIVFAFTLLGVAVFALVSWLTVVGYIL